METNYSTTNKIAFYAGIMLALVAIFIFKSIMVKLAIITVPTALYFSRNFIKNKLYPEKKTPNNSSEQTSEHFVAVPSYTPKKDTPKQAPTDKENSSLASTLTKNKNNSNTPV